MSGRSTLVALNLYNKSRNSVAEDVRHDLRENLKSNPLAIKPYKTFLKNVYSSFKLKTSLKKQKKQKTVTCNTFVFVSDGGG